MQNQTNDTTSAKDDSSTVDDIQALVPLTEEWLKAKVRQYASGKQVIVAEWALVKKSFLVAMLFLLLFISFLSVLLIVTNVFITFALLQADLHWLLVASIMLLLNLCLTVLCWKTLKRVAANISFAQSVQVLSGKVEITKDSDHE